ncbi:ERAD-associated protein [Saitoella coloradoensis]
MRAASVIVLTLLSTAIAAQAVADPEVLQQVIEDVEQPYESSTVDVEVVEGLPDIPEVETMKDYTLDKYTVPAMDLGRWDLSMVDPESQRLVDEALVLLRSLEPPETKSNAADSKAKEKEGGLISRWSRRAKSAVDALRILKAKSLETTQQKIQNDPLVQATLKLESAAAKSNPDALWLLADLNFHGNFSHPLNYAQATHYYSLLASATGNTSAQFLLGFLHATALGSGSSPDHAKAMTYYTFAAHQNETRAQRALAYRYHLGLGTPKNCEEAMAWYRRVAVTSRAYYRGGPPGGRHVKRESYRIADDEGGVYGHGASASSSGPGYLGSYRRNVINTNTKDGSFEDVFEYLQYVASKGDASAQSILGVLYYDGSRTQERNFGEAMYWFQKLAKQVWPSGIVGPGRAVVSPASGIASLAAKAAGYIGRMYLRGEGVEQDLKKAHDWFSRGVSMGDAMSQNGVGHMFLHGLSRKKDVEKAREYFKASAEQGFAPAQVNYAKLLLTSPQPSSLSAASQWLELAASKGHVEAYWLLGEMWANGVGRARSCERAVGYYKAVAERVEEVGPSGFEDGNRALQGGDLAGAIVYYMMAAEQGYEVGQANAAFLLDGDKTMLDPKAFLKTRSLTKVPKHPRLEKLALTYFSQSAHQSNVDSMVKMGDYFLHGFGLSPNTTDAKKAAQCYQAAERFHSAMAMWNLGWMHENGIGVEQDFHLAKRYYDQAALSSREAYAPVMMSLLKLRVRSAWNALTGGTINGIQKGPAPTIDTSWRSWLAKWYEHQPATAAPYRDREDDYDYTIYGDEYDDFGYGEDDLMESLVILTLCAVVGLFLWWRQRRVLRQRNGQQGADGHGHGLGRPDWIVPH